MSYSLSYHNRDPSLELVALVIRLLDRQSREDKEDQDICFLYHKILKSGLNSELAVYHLFN